MNANWIQKLALLIALIAGLNAYGDTLHPINTIEQAAYEFSLSKAQERYDNPQVVMGELDSRLRLQACDTQLEVFTNSVNAWLGNQTVGVKCSAPVAWTVYVPVEIKVFKPVVVAVKTLAANSVITKADVKLQPWDVSGLRQGYIKSINEIVGQQLKYAVSMGTVMTPTHVRPQKVVRRGEYITLVAVAGTMEVKMNGTAMSDASLGQRIKVKNTSSRRIVEGVVDAPGIVRVQL